MTDDLSTLGCEVYHALHRGAPRVLDVWWDAACRGWQVLRTHCAEVCEAPNSYRTLVTEEALAWDSFLGGGEDQQALRAVCAHVNQPGRWGRHPEEPRQPAGDTPEDQTRTAWYTPEPAQLPTARRHQRRRGFLAWLYDAFFYKTET